MGRKCIVNAWDECVCNNRSAGLLRNKVEKSHTIEAAGKECAVYAASPANQSGMQLSG